MIHCSLPRPSPLLSRGRRRHVFVTLVVWCASCLPSSGVDAVTLDRGPYLQVARPTSMLIVWRTAELADSTIEYGLDAGLGLSASSSERTRDHALLLDGLAPDTEHFYRVLGDGEALIEGLTFRTAPAPDALDVHFRFVAFGDTGTGLQPQYDVAAQVEASAPDLGIHIGDLAYPGGAPDDLDTKYFQVYRKTIARAPFYISLGNKEVEFDGGASYLEAFHFPEDSPDPERYYSFEHGNALFIALDTNQERGPGSVQARWLAAQLAASTRRWKIVFFHHPVHSSAPNDGAARAGFLPIFDEHGVDLVIQGHNHFYERTYPLRGDTKVDEAQEPAYESPRGTIYIVTGGGGGVLRTATPDANSARYVSTYHHVRVDIDRDLLRLEAVDSQGGVIDSMSIQKEGPPPPPVFHRGDADANGELQLTDAVRVLGFLFLGTERPGCLEAADADDNGEVQITDAVRILGFLFSGSAPPLPPGPPGSPCGPDPVGSADLGCDDYAGCFG